MKITIISTILLCSMLMSCGDDINKLKPIVENSKSMINVTINNDIPDNNLIDVELDPYVSKIEYIQLNVGDDNVISSIYRIYFTDDRIILFDKLAGRVFIFSRQGELINTIYKKGKANNEYLGMGAGLFDETKKQIIIYDPIQNKVLYYSMTGELIRTIKDFSNNDVIRDIINLPNGHFLCHTEMLSDKSLNRGLWEVDEQGKFVKSYFEYNNILPLLMTSENSAFQIMSDNKILIKDMIHSDLYQYNKGVVERVVNYNFTDNIIPKHIGVSMVDNYNPKGLASYTKGQNNIEYWHYDGGILFYTIHNKDNNKTIFVDKFLSKGLEIPYISSNYYFRDNNTDNIMSSYLPYDYFKSQIETGGFNESQKRKLNGLLSGFNEDNDILQLVYLK